MRPPFINPDNAPLPKPFPRSLSIWFLSLLAVIFAIVSLFVMRMKNPGEVIDLKTESRDDPKFSATTIGAASLGLFVDVGFSKLTDVEPALDGKRPPDADLPRPMEIFQRSPVPPFLSKIYDIVDDQALDSIVSWGRSGQSFVVWDPAEFARVVLPRNYKHNNFSTFVRQLNTYGFRKIDADRWEFSNEGFRRGKRHLLKNIQRRKSPQSQQPRCYSGYSIETVRPGVERGVEKLKTEKTILMKEVIELQQQQQRGTARHAQAISQRIQATEQKQKQMVSFLVKLQKNPSFGERLKERKEQKKIGSSRSKRKLLEHGRTEWDEVNPLVEGQVVEHGHSWGNLGDPSSFFMLDPLCSDLHECVSEDWKGMQWDSEIDSSQTCGFWSSDPVLPHDSSSVQGYFQNPPLVGEELLMVAAWDTKGKSPITSGEHSRASAEYFVSSPEYLEGKRSFTGFSSGFESIVKQEEIWSMGFDVSATISTPDGEPWDNITPFNEPVQGVTASLSDIWDLGQLPASRELGSYNWPEEPESKADQQEDSTSKEIDP